MKFARKVFAPRVIRAHTFVGHDVLDASNEARRVGEVELPAVGNEPVVERHVAANIEVQIVTALWVRAPRERDT